MIGHMERSNVYRSIVAYVFGFMACCSFSRGFADVAPVRAYEIGVFGGCFVLGCYWVVLYLDAGRPT